jgi:hypothetical protein
MKPKGLKVLVAVVPQLKGSEVMKKEVKDQVERLV